nr:uncharacterized protein LOC128704602 [Cherax quadricarinatus]
MVVSIVAAAMLALLGLTYAYPDSDALDTVEVGLSKRDLEFNQYVPGYRLRGEPSCEALRAMWRQSKREARRATSTNQLPRTRSYNYGRLSAFAPDPKARPNKHAYGHVLNYPVPQRASPFDTLRAILGPGDRRGMYEKVHRKLAAVRGPGRSSKGRYDELRRIMTVEQQEPRPLALSLRAAQETQPSAKSRRDPAGLYPRALGGSTQFSQQGFMGPLLPADSRQPTFVQWQPSISHPDTRECAELRGKMCRSDSDCRCSGLYRCSKARCKVSSKLPVVEDSPGSLV